MTIFSHFLRMHENGQRLKTLQYRNDSNGNKVLVHSAEVEYYSFSQAAAMSSTSTGLPPSRRVRGTSLQLAYPCPHVAGVFCIILSTNDCRGQSCERARLVNPFVRPHPLVLRSGRWWLYMSSVRAARCLFKQSKVLKQVSWYA